MRDLLILAIHPVVTFVKILRRGGVGTVVAESLALKHQLLISNRSHRRAPNLTTFDRIVLALTIMFVSPRRITKLGAVVKPSTLLKFHKMLVREKYRRLFSSSSHRHKPGPKGPSAELIAAIVEMKRRNSRLAACALPSKSLKRSDCRSTKMWSVAFSPATTGLDLAPMGPLGFRSLHT